ncbi:hypothetical protein TNCV_25671 [Trichonephila clavipes]|uniref:Uncharacterized protein n=1 Tax=Trichonephila clavipes TaxID=2585209 RepID=A0A8X7BC02_TRICX|nr:hypothetical protein TNCV_25671 [Trichonephila clavipes]
MYAARQKKRLSTPAVGHEAAAIKLRHELIAVSPWHRAAVAQWLTNHGRHVMSSIPVPLKTRRVGQRCTLNLSRAETSSRWWCGS